MVRVDPKVNDNVAVLVGSTRWRESMVGISNRPCIHVWAKTRLYSRNSKKNSSVPPSRPGGKHVRTYVCTSCTDGRLEKQGKEEEVRESDFLTQALRLAMSK
jgi:hypothetical protein